MGSLSFVLKIVERCNINCTYCYFFNGIDDSFKKHPPYIQKETIEQFSKYVKDAVLNNDINRVYVSFHGGEPLMLKKKLFSEMCELLYAEVGTHAKLEFSVQTNGMLIDNEWLDILAKFKVHIGISLDGPKELHDKYRIDKKGKGTFDRVLKRIALTKTHAFYKKAGIGILCVLTPGMNAIALHTYLIHELNIDAIDYLIPDNNYNYPSDFKPGQLGELLVALFKQWVEDDKSTVHVRFFKSLLGFFFGAHSKIYGVGPYSPIFPLVTVSSNGELAPVDEFRSTNPKLMENNGNISRTPYNELIRSTNFQATHEALTSLPKECQGCCWRNICNGGPVVTRYSQESAFKKKSYFCEDLKILYREVAGYLLDNGFRSNEIIRLLS